MIKQKSDNFKMLGFLNKFIAENKGFICGGCFKDIFNKKQVRDIDIFFESPNDYNEAVLQFNNNDEFVHYYSSKNAEGYRYKNADLTIELCHSIYGTPEQILKQFDFTIVKFAYFKERIDIDTEITTEYKVLYHERFFEHLLLKRLVVDENILLPISTFERMLKYIRYGFYPCYETKLRLLTAINQLSETQVQVKENLYDGYD